jgi:tyrosine aminotransferase
LLQSALPRVLTPTAGSDDEKSLQLFHDNYMHTLRKNTQICVDLLKNVSELNTNAPKGAMYIMLKINIPSLFDINDDKEFAEKLLTEENLSVLPGACFNMGGYIRLVTCPPEEIFADALERLKLFCSRHNVVNQPTTITTISNTVTDMNK